MAQKNSDQNTISVFIRHKELLIFGCICISLIQLISFISYNPYDISFYTTSPNEPRYNFAGIIGAYFTFIHVFTFGFSILIAPLFWISLIYQLYKEIDLWDFCKWALYFQLNLISGSILLSIHNLKQIEFLVSKFQITGCGGILGSIFGQEIIIPFLGKIGGSIFFLFLFLISLQGIFPFSYVKLIKNLHQICKFLLIFIKKKTLFLLSLLLYLYEKVTHSKSEEQMENEDESEKPATIKPIAKIKKKILAKQNKEPENNFYKAQISRGDSTKAIFSLPRRKVQGWEFPSLSLLNEPIANKLDLAENIEANADKLAETLGEFDIETEVVGIESGPVITRYEIQIASGTKVSKVTSLDNDIGLAMRAKSVRIIAPIPGKSAIGIEIPNQIRKMVSFRELLASKEFKNLKADLPLILGKDISGKAIIADLSKMPHLLIAGATGAGKSVCINTIIISILYTLSPSEVKILLVDPKKVELAMYKKLPHLFVPLITNPNKVSKGLHCLIEEMDRRYQLFKEVGVRNLDGYNKKDKTSYHNKLKELDPDIDILTAAPEKLPFVIVVIDELADLMMVAKSEIESSIVRLAQLSRAVGIHMILATQRPSVDVVTGLIKANVPSRIAFRVSARVDSRTVLDSMGAEKLLGKGDMLFLDPGDIDLHRIQGAFLEDDEITRVVEHWENQGEPEYDSHAMNFINKPQHEMNDNIDPLYDQAIEAIRSYNQASTTFLQKKFRIGYNRASRLMDDLESRGIVGPATSGGKTREIYLDENNE